MGKKKILFLETNGCTAVEHNYYNMVVSIDSENNCRYITESDCSEIPHIAELELDEKRKAANDFLNSIKDDSSWNGVVSYNELFNVTEYGWTDLDFFWFTVAEIEKEL